jgi:hypothetical protein
LKEPSASHSSDADLVGRATIPIFLVTGSSTIWRVDLPTTRNGDISPDVLKALNAAQWHTVATATVPRA